MKIKGTAVKSTKLFIFSKFPKRYNEWLETLPEKNREYYTNTILPGDWYPLVDAVLIPTKIAGELFYDGDFAQAGFDMGKESAIEALRGIYKIFVKIASVDFVLKQIKGIFSTYYSTGNFEMIFREEKKVEFLVTGFKKGEELIFDRISGWVEGVFSVISDDNFKVKKDVHEEGDNLKCKIIAFWE